MRQVYSRTAERAALVRAIEQHQSIERRIVIDPYAINFLQRRAYRFIAGSRVRSRLLLRFLDHWAPGGQEFLAIRARLVDDLAAELAGEGIDQIVILGAGFDTLALRIKESLWGVTIFEVDHPRTQLIKRLVMQRMGLPGNIRFIAADFEKDDFVEKLYEAGFDRSSDLFIIWVGVSYYLTEPVVARSLRQISSLSVAGTRLVWDYMLAEIVDGTTKDLGALAKARKVARLGEPWLFGLRPDQVADYLAQFGFRLIKDYEPGELRALYCLGRPAPVNYARIVLCEHV
jgi:methyltransferase (TIGR00027 family)